MVMFAVHDDCEHRGSRSTLHPASLKESEPAAKMRWVAGVVCSTSEERAKMAK